MKIIRPAIAGTLESSDILIKISPKIDQDIEIIINSSVGKRFGKQIRKTILEVLDNMSITSVLIEIEDKGALDCIIKARMETALLRASDNQDIKLESLS